MFHWIEVQSSGLVAPKVIIHAVAGEKEQTSAVLI
jgi:hypothetical protein